jgi:hypothetical protein
MRGILAVAFEGETSALGMRFSLGPRNPVIKACICNMMDASNFLRSANVAGVLIVGGGVNC